MVNFNLLTKLAWYLRNSVSFVFCNRTCVLVCRILSNTGNSAHASKIDFVLNKTMINYWELGYKHLVILSAIKG